MNLCEYGNYDPINKSLILYDDFNQIVGLLPNSITNLTFGKSFNQSVDNLPNSITHLTFSYYFNQSIDNLPNSITHLTFCSIYTKIHQIPIHISIIEILFAYEDKYNKVIDNLPLHIKEIYIDRPEKINLIKKIPFGCKVFCKINDEVKILKE